MVFTCAERNTLLRQLSRYWADGHAGQPMPLALVEPAQLHVLLDGLVLVQFFQPHDHHTVPMRSMVVTLCRHGSVRRAGCGVGACGPERRGKSQKSPSKRQRHGSQHGVRHLPQPVTWLEAGGKERTGRVMPKQCCALVGRQQEL